MNPELCTWEPQGRLFNLGLLLQNTLFRIINAWPGSHSADSRPGRAAGEAHLPLR